MSCGDKQYGDDNNYKFDIDSADDYRNIIKSELAMKWDQLNVP